MIRLTFVTIVAVFFLNFDSVRSQPIATGIVSGDLLQQIEAVVQSGIEAGQLPGCVIAFGRSQELRFINAYGNRQLEPVSREMKIDTVFDLASLTKPTTTAVSVMLLEQEERIELNSPLAKYMPEFSNHGKESITVRDALLHQSGLIADNSMTDYAEGPEVAWKNICQLKLVGEVGKQFRYSDVNFIVLGKMVERVSGKTLDQFAAGHLFTPLNMHNTTFNPGVLLRERCAPTEKRDGDWIVGQVHDPRAFALGGVAGHAGLFSTAGDLAKYSQAILRRMKSEDDASKRRFPLDGQNLKRMTDAYSVSKGSRGLGWDKQSPYSSNRGTKLSESAFGHGGFTGTVLWIDPKLDFFFIFLSNRLHPDGKGSVNRMAAEIQDLILDSGS